MIAGIVGSNPADGMDVRLLCLSCVELVASPATETVFFEWVCGRFLDRIARSNPAVGMMFFSSECCVWSGRCP